MKKFIASSTLALTLGVTGVTAGQTAEASEYTVNQDKLVNLALYHQDQLNNAPVQEGAYNINFNCNGLNYSFVSDGTYWAWSYGAGEQDASKLLPGYKADVKTSAVSYEAPKTTHTQSYNQVSNTTSNVTTSTTTYQAPQVTQAPVQRQVQTQAVSTGGSVYDQFIAAGGTDSMWRNIVLPESGGNPNIVSLYGYRGLGQTKEHWGTGSVAYQTQGMLNYAVQRYGSVENAVNFRLANNWW
ncbi:hypothetical protein [Staphylococcus massiliensis]|uniref:SceA protein n=1 Tax=Staphylococcus massiliensis S46 TaxID=1229783 RepID=K9B034_9STAP|nr:hypothetical protein [Staphylococcus massiliensis]EKU47150.1 SceA protein [Staphylococcus massiliensis S46]POA01891.1 SceA protein [Staphylococcus massiliensis CCUG 55927]